MAAIDIQNPCLLVDEMEVGGEILDTPRGDCRDHGRYAAIRLLGWDRKAVYFRGALYVHCQNDSVC